MNERGVKAGTSCTPRGIMLWLCLLAWTGCAVGPNFERPQVQVPAQWAGPKPPAPSVTPVEKDLAQWWTVFQDQTLTSLVQRAVETNLDLKFTEARIRQARAARGIAVAGLGPTVDATGSFRRSQAPGSPGANGAPDIKGPLTNEYQAGFDASWEMDIFGGIRREIEAADADLQTTIEARRDMLVILTAEVARNYIDLRALQQRIAVARKNLKAQEHSAKLTHQRFQSGFAGGLDVAEAQAQVATTAAQIPLLESSARQSIYSLSVLLGKEPAALVQEMSPAAAIPDAPPSAPVGLPSDLLRRRPDIRRAEAGIHSATARIGVATADLYPRFFMFGSGGYQSSSFGSWFDPVSLFWSLGPALSWTAFDTGRIRSTIEVNKALEEESVLSYRQTVLSALQEVENALIASEKEQEHRRALVDAVAANRKAVELATILYTEGHTDFLNVLQAQRSLYTSEDSLVQSTRTVSTNLVALYKALGGGWDTATMASDPTSAQ